MSFWNIFPNIDTLEAAADPAASDIYDVNAHVHTPYSFSAFYSIDHALELAGKENVKVLGINDFYSTSGYAEWAEVCTKHKIFPLFNIEFVGLSPEEQEKGIRINDPNNPGRIYVSGKGLAFPVKLEEPYATQLQNLNDSSNDQVKEMTDALNKHLTSLGIDIQFSFDDIMRKYTKGLVRERHLAKVLRIAVMEKASSEEEAKKLFTTIFGGKEPKSALDNEAALENEIRSALLKSGGAAFIPESPEQFLNLDGIRELILKSGGVPTYPLLADSVNGGYTEFEESKEALLETLTKKGIYSIEFITNRNSTAALEDYASFFVEKGFMVSFGSEHNTPELIPIKLFDKASNDLSNKLKQINYDGACLLAAHQYLMATTGESYLDSDGKPKLEKRDEYTVLGRKLIAWFLNN